MHLVLPPVQYGCLSAKPWHQRDFALPTLQNNEPVPQVIETGCKPVLFGIEVGEIS